MNRVVIAIRVDGGVEGDLRKLAAWRLLAERAPTRF